jgi:putative addiction module component (TIGR02574 family)
LEKMSVDRAFLEGEQMSPAGEALLRLALKLPEADRLELADALIAASEPPEAVRAAWLAEAHRRTEELHSGKVTPIPWEEVKRRLHAPTEGQPGG